MLYIPCRPSLGSQKFLCIRCGARGNSPGGYAFPRSKTHTSRPASASRYAVTEPPKPEPTITASKYESLVLWFILPAHLLCIISQDSLYSFGPYDQRLAFFRRFGSRRAP